MRRILVFTAIAGLVLGLTPARAWHQNDIPVIAGADNLGNGWAAFKVTTDGGMYAIDLETEMLTGPVGQLAGFFYAEDNSFLGGFSFTAFTAKQGAYVDLNPPGYNVHQDVESPGPGGLFKLGFTFNDPQYGEPFVGTWKIVVWWAGNAKWSWAFRAYPGTTIDSSDGGTRAHIFESRDFHGTAQAEAYADGKGGRASVQASYPLTVQDTLVGFYQMGLTAAGTMSVTTPSGERSCGLTPVVVPLYFIGGICLFYEMQGAERAGPGDYTFNTTSAGAGFAGPFDDIWFGGADARLPA